MRRRSASGVVLLLISGVVTILVLLSLAILQAARIFGARAAAQAAAARSELAASAGLEYAAARLSREDTYPVTRRTLENRGDDWAERQGPGIRGQGSENPSYSHGESWIEGGAPDGTYSPADAPGPDRDGDGAHSAWSGRLRSGGGSRSSILFRLRVEATEGKIPLNAGSLETGEASSVGPYYHQALAHALDNLGAVVRPMSEASGPGWFRREDVQTGDFANGNPGDAIECSWLGKDLIGSRPAGGYRSMEEVRATLERLGYRASAADPVEWDRIRPYLDLGPYEGPAGRTRAPDRVPYTPICLAAAPREVLESLWRYVATLYRSCLCMSLMPGQAEDWALPCSRTGDPAKLSTFAFSGSVPNLSSSIVHPRIWPDEARKIADLAISLREARRYGWTDLHRKLVRGAPVLFQRDWDDLGARGAASDGRARVSWVQAKADLAFVTVAATPSLVPCIFTGAPFPYGWPNTEISLGPMDPFALLATRGIDRDPTAGGIQARFGCSTWLAFSTSFPNYPALTRTSIPSAPGAGWTYNPYEAHVWQGAGLVPQGLSMGPPVLFEVESLARNEEASARLAGRLRACERLDFATQEDFENLSGAPALSARGIEALEIPGAEVRRNAVDDGSGRVYPRISTFPDPSYRSYVPPGGTPSSFCRWGGALGLATREYGMKGGTQYFPFREDFDRNPATDLCEGAGLYPTPSPAPYRSSPSGVLTAGTCPWATAVQSAQTVIEGMTIEARMSPYATINMGGRKIPFPGVLGSIRLFTSRGRDPSSLAPGTVFRLTTSWRSIGGMAFAEKAWFIPDPPGLPCWSHHVVLTGKRVSAKDAAGRDWYHTEIHLYVNGLPHPTLGDMMIRHGWDYGWLGVVGDGEMLAPTATNLRLQCADEIRFHAGYVDAGGALALYEADRHVPRGTFLSPLYVPDFPVRLSRAQWSGIVPDGYPNPFEIQILGYGTRDGSGPETPLPLDPAGWATTLPDAGRLRSFRYKVGIDCAGWPSPLAETPYFESIWMTLSRGAAAPRWAAWAPR